MGDHVAVEHLDGKHVAIHFIALPPFTEKGAYAAIRSYESFKSAMHRWLMRHIAVDRKHASKGIYLNREIPGQYFYLSWWDDFEITRKHGARIYDGLPEHHWTSILEFFEHVGYDRKTRKLTSWKTLCISS